MSSANQNPSYLRYLKARLAPLKRPTFWGSAAGLSLALLLVGQYWNDPEAFEANWNKFVASLDSPTTEPELSSQELAARMADIDSSEVLLEEFDRTNLLPVTVQTDPETKKNNNSGNSLSPLATPSQAGANSGQGSTNSSLLGTSQQNQNASNPLGLSSSGLSNIGSLGGSSSLTGSQASNKGVSSTSVGSTPDSLLGFNSLSYFNTNQSSLPTSPLQEALNRMEAAKSSSSGNSAQAPAEAQSQALTSPTNQGQIAPPPATIPSASLYNAGGQPTYPPVTAPIPSYNAAGQPTYPPVSVPGASGYNAYPTTPTAPTNSYNYLVPPPAATGGVPPAAPIAPGNFGQYPNQTPNQAYGVPNAGFNSTQGTSGFQQNQPAFSVPGRIPGRTLGGGRMGTFSNPHRSN
ncbi:MAG: hypothetical protein LDL41_24320 [Coleofasciculus sp. S288]|nr:hypothetical protein [Coleofasciculus sp. S288]